MPTATGSFELLAVKKPQLKPVRSLPALRSLLASACAAAVPSPRAPISSAVEAGTQMVLLPPRIEGSALIASRTVIQALFAASE